jgi:PhzF family phenazine biosynthesis protein
VIFPHARKYRASPYARSVHRFTQLNVFSAEPLGGNPLAVVHDAADLSSDQMRRFASWTNLSETTFLLPPSHERADYRVRIFTPSTELPFAGHPTLGSARAWLEAGGRPREDGVVMQECGAGLVEVRLEGGRAAFAAPPLIRQGTVEPELLERLRAGLGLRADEVMAAFWLDNGPGWIVVQVAGAKRVLAIRPQASPMAGLEVGVVGRHERGAEADVEVRAFSVDDAGTSVHEDPVTGSLNAVVGQWLTDLPATYIAAQGTALGRTGRVHVRRAGDQVWVGGETQVLIRGEVEL